MDSERDIVQLALDGRLTEEQAVGYVEQACSDKALVREILEKVASAGVVGGMRTASSLVDWVLAKCSGNRALLGAVVALMLSSGTLSAHVVQKGDTLWRLGGGTQKGVQQILALNPSVTENTVLKPGMKLALPSEQKAGGTYTVVKGDTFSGIAKSLGTTVKELQSLNPQVKDIDRLSIGQKLNTPSGKGQPKKTTTQPSTQSKTDAQTDYIARVIYAESGNSVDEMEMIAHLIVNRMKDTAFPSTAYGVVTQRRQFSCTSGTDGNARWKGYSRNLNSLTRKAYELAEKVVKGDASGMKGNDSSLFYCTKSIARNGVGKGTEGLAKDYGHPKGWGSYSTFTPVETSANHVFYECERL